MRLISRLKATLVPLLLLVAGLPEFARADETFVTIHRVAGNRLSVTMDSGSGRGRRGGQAETPQSQSPGQASSRPAGRERGRFASRGNTTASQQVVVTVPSTAKITSGMRERRTFEFRAGAELAGGLRNRVFQNLQKPLSARIVTQGNVITEVNVITPETDINQSNVDAGGGTVIAIRPKRPPMKRK